MSLVLLVQFAQAGCGLHRPLPDTLARSVSGLAWVLTSNLFCLLCSLHPEVLTGYLLLSGMFLCLGKQSMTRASSTRLFQWKNNSSLLEEP